MAASDGGRAGELLAALRGLRTAAADADLPLPVPGADEARRGRQELIGQLDDYIIPRVASVDAPLLAVIGGSTGAGKSTLVNSIVGETLTRAGVLRPTTRASTLLHHPGDRHWFEGDRVLPDLARVSGADRPGDPHTLRLVPCDAVPAGLALLDAPDIDSVVTANRDLARQLLLAADLWLFVTTAARYADAVPWELLHQAITRGTSVAVVLDRVPVDAMEEVRADLAGMLAGEGLGQSPVFAIAESRLTDGLLPADEVRRIRGWLVSLASDSRARSMVIRRTLDGALDSLAGRTAALQQARAAQRSADGGLRRLAADAYQDAVAGVEDGMRDGSMLRGEVLARWQEFVGTGELLRQLDASVSRLRDRVTSHLRGTGRGRPADHLEEALHTGVAALLHANAENAAMTTNRSWKSDPAGAVLLRGRPELASCSPDFTQRADRLVRDWQGEVLTMVRQEAGGKRTTARFLAFGVNGIAVMLMLIVFSATAGLSGAEIGIAGGSAILAQRLLEAVFGDQAVRNLAVKARARLLERTRALYDDERSRYDQVLDEATGGTRRLTPDALDRAVTAVKESR